MNIIQLAGQIFDTVGKAFSTIDHAIGAVEVIAVIAEEEAVGFGEQLKLERDARTIELQRSLAAKLEQPIN